MGDPGAALGVGGQLGAEVEIRDGNDSPVRLKNVVSGQPTCVVFLRHWLCPPCQAHGRSLSDAWRAADLAGTLPAGAKLVAVGSRRGATGELHSLAYQLAY